MQLSRLLIPALFGLSVVGPVLAQDSGVDVAALNKRAAGMARRTASDLFRPGTPEYTAALRHLVGAYLTAHGSAPDSTMQQLSNTKVTLFDLDPRFRRSLTKSLSLAIRFDLVQPFVLDSQPDTAMKYPDIVLVRGPNNSICSGVVIGPRRVLTARHCVCRGISMSVGIGSSKIEQMTFKSVVNRRPTPAQCQLSSSLDLGMLFTEEGVMPSGRFEPPATTEQIDTAQSTTVVGFGVSVYGQGSSGERRSASLSVLSRYCTGSIRDAAGQVQSEAARFGCHSGLELVAASSTGADQCDGDSGGALLAVDNSGKSFLAGVVSGPTNQSQVNGGCGDGGVYVRIDTKMAQSWINDNST